MKKVSLSGRAFRRTLGVSLAVVGLGVALAASASAGTAKKAATPQALANQVLMTPTTLSSLDPIIQSALTTAAKPLTAAQYDKAYACWKAAGCTLGSGKVILGVADGFGDNTWRKFTLMELILQAMAHPEVGKIVYTNAHGNLATMGANIRSLTAQGAQIIMAYNDFGPAAYPAFAAAAKKGVITATYVGPARPIPGAPESAVNIAVGPDICVAGQQMAEQTAKSIGGKGAIAYFTGVAGNPQDVAWQKCASDVFKKSYPGITVDFKADTSWTPAGVFQAASALISSGKDVKAILYSYSNPVPQILKAYGDAGKKVPAIITWTWDNGTTCQWKKLSAAGKGFDLFQTNGINWPVRVAVDATLAKFAGEKVPATVIYPLPFVKAKAADCVASMPTDYPGSSSLIPMAMIKKMLGA